MSISISGKDKMCLINGDVGGAIYASVDFGTREEVDDEGNKELVDINIEDIIREAVHEYGHEPWERIIIKDIPKYGLFLLEWTGDEPLYALIRADGSDETANVYIDQGQIVYEDGVTPIPISEVPVYLSTNELNLVNKDNYTVVTTGGTDTYYVCKINPGQSAGYDVTELTYPRDNDESGLITSVGDSVTSVLDKIVDFLGNYEYFFDVDGNFIFQKKDKWIDTNWNANDFDTVSMGNDYTLLSYLPTSWLFEGGELVVDFNNSPNIGNIKNDYAIWGERKNGDTAIPIHMRQAVDKKPIFYKSISVSKEELDAYKKLYPEFANGFKNVDANGNWPSIIYYTSDCPQEYIPAGATAYEEDWRELIYQMALDYRRFNHFDTFNTRILENNIIPKSDGTFEVLYPKGITGYEQYYVDLEGFWRYLYHPDYDNSSTTGKSIKELEELDYSNDIFIRDHFYNIDIPIPEGSTQYYVGKVEDKPYLIEHPTWINPQNYINNKYTMWETNAVVEEWTGEDYSSNDFVVHSQGAEDNKLPYGKATGLYYDNGAEKDLRYDGQGYIVTDLTDLNGSFRLEKYNLLLPVVTNITLSQLQNHLTTRNTTYNSYTVYNTGDDGYYMLELVQNGQASNNYELVKIKMPTVSGIQRDDNSEQIYRFSYSNQLNCQGTYLTKVSTFNAIPSTYTYDKFYVVSNIGMLSLMKEEPTCFINNAMGSYRWHPFKNNAMFNFTGDINDINNSSLWLSKENDYINTDNLPNQTTTLITGNGDNLVKQYSYIKYNNAGVPVLKDNNYTFTHSPIAYYQDTYYYDYSEGYTGKWNILVKESPELLIFWFDFLDSQTSEIGKYGVNNVMDRSKASNESNVKAIYYRDTLNIVQERLSKSKSDPKYKKLVEYTRSGYNIMQAGDWVFDYFQISNCGKSCKDVLDQWLYQYTQANESVSISCIPIYTLEPNNRISVHDDNIKINGEYIINSISIPLTYNGTMSINAVKAVDKLQ